MSSLHHRMLAAVTTVRRLVEHETLWSSAGYVLVGTIVARALGLLFPVVVARATDEDGFALVYFFVSTGWLVSELVITGFPTAFTRFFAADRSPDRGAWLTSSLAGGTPLVAISLACGAVLSHAADAPPVLMGLVVIGLTVDGYYFSVLRGLGSFGLLAAYRVGANLAQILLLLIFLGIGIDSVEAIVAIYSFTYIVPILLIEARYAPALGLLRGAPRPTRARIASLTRFAVPALVSGTAYGGILGFDVFFVRIFAPEALADYGAARTLSLPMTFFPYAVATVLLPRAAAASATERWSFLRRALAVSAFIAIGGAIGYAFAGPFIVELVFPPEYGGADAAMRILAAALGLMGLYSILSQWWLGLGRPLVPAASLTVGALVAVTGHVTLTASHGSLGAGVSVALGTAAALAILGFFTLRMWAHERNQSLVPSPTPGG